MCLSYTWELLISGLVLFPFRGVFLYPKHSHKQLFYLESVPWAKESRWMDSEFLSKSCETQRRKWTCISHFLINNRTKRKTNLKQISPDYSFILNGELQSTSYSFGIEGEHGIYSCFLLLWLRSLQEEPKQGFCLSDVSVTGFLKP